MPFIHSYLPPLVIPHRRQAWQRCWGRSRDPSVGRSNTALRSRANGELHAERRCLDGLRVQTSSMSMPPYAAVIVTFRRPDSLRMVINALIQQTHTPTMVVVADNDPEGLAEVVTREFAGSDVHV